jgi:ubiquinone/menaquinone biosynthesis C-methylase UbiE
MEPSPTTTSNTYVLGSDQPELARLDRQAAMYESASALLLKSAGIAPGMRVLDLGTGLGHVARLAGDLVGPTGSVVGLDRAAAALAVARQRVAAAGERHVTFVEGDVTSWSADEPFDAVVGRLLLFHLPDAIGTIRHHMENLRAGGLFVALDFDIGGSRAEPGVAAADDALDWVMRAFTAAGACPTIGARLGPMLEAAGLGDVTTFGIQSYLPPRNPAGAAMLASVVRSLGDAIIGHHIATSEQLDLPTLEGRIRDALLRDDAVLLPPTLVGAWGRRVNT